MQEVHKMFRFRFHKHCYSVVAIYNLVKALNFLQNLPEFPVSAIPQDVQKDLIPLTETWEGTIPLTSNRISIWGKLLLGERFLSLNGTCLHATSIWSSSQQLRSETPWWNEFEFGKRRRFDKHQATNTNLFSRVQRRNVQQWRQRERTESTSGSSRGHKSSTAS